jgi:hypothetical protein
MEFGSRNLPLELCPLGVLLAVFLAVTTGDLPFPPVMLNPDRLAGGLFQHLTPLHLFDRPDASPDL